MKNQAIVFIGRAGCGKGTQSKLLIDVLKAKDPRKGIIDIEAGVEFRKLIEGPSYTAHLAKTIVDTGKLVPEFMPIYLWSTALVTRYTGNEHIVFDGTPRKVIEAESLDSAFPFYGFDKPWIIYVNIDHEESVKRLTSRLEKEGRKDDVMSAIEQRRIAFDRDVLPTIEYFRTHHKNSFLDIDGKRSVDEVHKDIVNKLGL